jgi:hypothetical protein
MFRHSNIPILAAAILRHCGTADEVAGQETRTETILAHLRAKKDSKDRKNVVIEALAPGGGEGPVFPGAI